MCREIFVRRLRNRGRLQPYFVFQIRFTYIELSEKLYLNNKCIFDSEEEVKENYNKSEDWIKRSYDLNYLLSLIPKTTGYPKNLTFI